jgi:UPF0755 protein
MSDLIILQRAFHKMEKVLEEEWNGRQGDLPIKTRDEALTLASIVEKETGKAEERALIAGVFVRRLRIGMKLQTDPTVIYGIGDRFNGNLTVKDLRTPSAYNTYVIKGLPPSPIAMPGRHALHAALNPENTKALYFVSRGDGSHEFSETYEQHNRAVTKYQLKGRPKAEASVRPVAASGGGTCHAESRSVHHARRREGAGKSTSPHSCANSGAGWQARGGHARTGHAAGRKIRELLLHGRRTWMSTPSCC